MDLRLTTELSAAAPRDDEWQRLASALSPESRFATVAWIRAWGKSFLPHENWFPPLRYLTVRGTDGQLRAVFPFATQKKFGISFASLGGFYWPFRSPIIPESSRAETFSALADGFTNSWRTIALRYGPVHETHPAIVSFNAALENRGWRVHRFTLGETYAVSLPDTWEQFENSLGRNLRTHTYYYERKMRREGELEIRCIRNITGPSWAKTIHDLGVVEGKSWQRAEGGQPRFFGKRNQGFWMSLLCESGFGDMVSVWLMYFKGEPVSFCFCLDCAHIRHIFANSYAENVRAYSTGSVLYRHVFQDAVESRTIRRVNIGMGDSGYKARWGAQPSFQLVDWIAFRPGVRGRLLDFVNRVSLRFRDVQASDGRGQAEPSESRGARNAPAAHVND